MEPLQYRSRPFDHQKKGRLALRLRRLTADKLSNFFNRLPNKYFLAAAGLALLSSCGVEFSTTTPGQRARRDSQTIGMQEMPCLSSETCRDGGKKMDVPVESLDAGLDSSVGEVMDATTEEGPDAAFDIPMPMDVQEEVNRDAGSSEDRGGFDVPFVEDQPLDRPLIDILPLEDRVAMMDTGVERDVVLDGVLPLSDLGPETADASRPDIPRDIPTMTDAVPEVSDVPTDRLVEEPSERRCYSVPSLGEERNIPLLYGIPTVALGMILIYVERYPDDFSRLEIDWAMIEGRCALGDFFLFRQRIFCSGSFCGGVSSAFINGEGHVANFHFHNVSPAPLPFGSRNRLDILYMRATSGYRP